jgi:integrase
VSVQKRTWKATDGKAKTGWRVRWQVGEHWESRTFTNKADADAWDRHVKDHQRLGTVADLGRGTQTLDAFVAETFTPAYVALLAPKTQAVYAALYDRHISQELGSLPLRDFNAETIRKWQAGRLKAGVGPSAVHKSVTLLGSILQRAVEGEHISSNPARGVKRTKVPKRPETIPFAPATVEAMRGGLLDPQPVQVAASDNGKRRRRAYSAPAPGTPQTRHRDATIISVLAYAGLRPQEMLALKWSDVQERTIRVYSPKTDTTRSVRLLSPLAADLKTWKMASGRPAANKLIFPAENGSVWPETAWQSWRTHQFARALKAVSIDRARPYDLRHSFASLLLHEGRNVIYVARQLGHDARLTLSTYGHVIEELDGAPQMDAEAAIQAARSGQAAHQLPKAVSE